MLVYIKEKERGEVIDFRESAPNGAHPGLFRGNPEKGIRGQLVSSSALKLFTLSRSNEMVV